MSWLDVILLFSLLGYVWGGFTAGLIQSLGGLIGLIIGAFVASRTYESFSPAVTPLVGGSSLVGNVVAFVLVFFIVTRIIAILVWFINKLFNIIAIVPGLKLLNKFGGALFGFLEGALFLGLTLQFVNRLPIPTNWAASLDKSFMVPFLLGIAAWLVPFLPKALKASEKALDQYLKYPKDLNQVKDTYDTIKNTGVLNSNLPL